MIPAEVFPVLIFICIVVGVIALASLITPSRDRIAERARSLSGGGPRPAEPGASGRWARRALTWAASPLASFGAPRQDALRLRLTHAGYDGPNALPALWAARLILVLLPLVGAAAAAAAGALTLETAAGAGAVLSALGMLAPGIWLESGKKAHQNELRRGLPDFFDVIVLCVEGGMSLLASWRRVADELRSSYPTLWKELKIVEQEVEIGRPMGEALSRCAERTDLDEVASLASVVRQAEQLGTELARPMRSLSDVLREQRVQRAEEAAHKTATKIMFPTLLFIFPCVFAILLGPMIIEVVNIFSGAKK